MTWWIAIVVGGLLALLLDLRLRRGGAAAARRGWAVGLLVAAVIYVVFGLFGGIGAVGLEAVGVLVYLPFALLGRRGRWDALAAGWALHVLWDVALHGPTTPFVPLLYPPLCIGFDLIAAGLVATRYRD